MIITTRIGARNAKSLYLRKYEDSFVHIGNILMLIYVNQILRSIVVILDRLELVICLRVIKICKSGGGGGGGFTKP